MVAFVQQALQKDLSQRFGTATEMTAALDEMLTMSGDERFGLFISYRRWCDKLFAEALFTAASKCQLQPGREYRMKVYLDTVRIAYGQPFDVNFARGLANSTVFSPLVSANCLKNFVELGDTDKEDFVLAEWIVALTLQKQGIVKAILPIVMGEQSTDGKYSETFFESLRDSRVSWPASHPDASFTHPAGSGTIPVIVSAKSTAKAKEFLGMLDPPVTLSEDMTVDAVVKKILTFQAVLLHFQNDQIDSLDSMQLVRIDSTHGERAKEIARKHTAQTCAERIAKVIIEHESGSVEPEPELEPESEPGAAALENAQGLSARSRAGAAPLENAQGPVMTPEMLKAGRAGDATAQCVIGYCYAAGQGVRQHWAEALKWYRAAAEQGHPNAQYNLGTCYAKGRSVRLGVDVQTWDECWEKAVYWFSLATEQGDAAAQCNLATCYLKGQGVEQDRPEAIRWYEQAAQRGDEKARRHLEALVGGGGTDLEALRGTRRGDEKARREGAPPLRGTGRAGGGRGIAPIPRAQGR
jgi:hypothetical protein